MRLRLRVVRGAPSDGDQDHELGPGASLTIGRASTNTIALKVQGVSRTHCRVEASSVGAGGTPELRLVDLGSKHGTTVNGKPVDGAVVLRHGDVIRLGQAKVEVELVGDTAPRDTLADVAYCESCGRTLARDSLVLGRAVSYGRHWLCATCQASLSGAERVGRYDLLAALGSGTFGTVYRAVDAAGGRIVALKRLCFRVDPDPQVLARFQREVRLLEALAHPNLVAVHDSGACERGFFYAMELVRGADLLGRIASDAPLAVSNALAIAAELLDGLAYIHDRGVVHRDIKPQNVLVDLDGRVKLVDFGLAKKLDDTGLTQITATREGMGTPRYMPPEQFEDARSADARADVYSAGATLYHALAGKPLFHDARKLSAIASRVKTEVPPRLDAIRADVPAAVASAVARALEKDPARRFPTALELRQALLDAPV